jgi:hypothetical protein
MRSQWLGKGFYSWDMGSGVLKKGWEEWVATAQKAAS